MSRVSRSTWTAVSISGGCKMNYFQYDVLVIGSGAAGFNAVNRLKESGSLSVALITEEINCGTSRNTGSDKQTYYKLGICGDAPDSVRLMAEELFASGIVDGDSALCEAANSLRCFMNLCELGVPFPTDRYGEYVGYKTDHDLHERATSAGPLTSLFMTEALEKRAKKLNVEILDGLLAIEILKDDNNGVSGILCVEKATGKPVGIKAGNIILATGGPAGIYADSVYPTCHTGCMSLAVTCGAQMQNLTEWQYGLASTEPRWNVSGTYMQVLPRFVSVDADGNEHEFLLDYFGDAYTALSAVFLKGYQWPFDSKKILDGSSVIDLLVYTETVLKKRKVYLDYTKNPFGLTEIEYEKLSPEAYTYLKKADTLFGTPLERLLKMNAPAVELYRNKGKDLSSEYLPIALCAQHHNGGIAVDAWWQTNISGLFAVGECAGTHGIVRPGGSALNAGQVGSLRAANFIVRHPRKADTKAFETALEHAVQNLNAAFGKILKDTDNSDILIDAARRRMSDGASAIRNPEHMKETLEQTEKALADAQKDFAVKEKSDLYKFFKYTDTLLTQRTVISAFLDYAEKIGKTRGSALYYQKDGKLRKGLSEMFRFAPDSEAAKDKIQTAECHENKIIFSWRTVRPIPETDVFFENVWRSYRENGNVY